MFGVDARWTQRCLRDRRQDRREEGNEEEEEKEEWEWLCSCVVLVLVVPGLVCRASILQGLVLYVVLK